MIMQMGDKILNMNRIMKKMPLPALAALSAAFLLGTTNLAFAQAASLGDVLCNAFANAKPFGQAFQWVAWAIGAVMTIQGIHGFRQHAEGPQNNPMTRPIMLWFGAGCLFAVPQIAGMVANSFYTTGGGGSMSCSVGSTGGGASLDLMVAGFVGNIKGPIIAFSSIVAMLSGLFMIVNGLVKSGKYGHDPRANSIHQILTNLGFGALLLTIGDNLNMMMSSVFGSSTVSEPTQSSVLSWGFVSSVGGGSAQFANAIAAALAFIQIIGAIAFVRGWLILKKVVGGDGQTSMAQGITHILGGVLAINIPAFLKIMDTTFGTNLM